MSRLDNLGQGGVPSLSSRWTDVYALLSAANEQSPLEAEDLDRLAAAAYLIGKDAESVDAWTRAHQAFLSRGDVERAVRCAFWLSFVMTNLGERAHAEAWVARGERLLESRPESCVEEGYLLLHTAMGRLFGGDTRGAYEEFCRAGEIADRFGDPDLVALARHSRGRVLIRLGETREGVRMLDEAMLAVDAGEVTPLVVGDVYCSVIEGCLEVFDLRRAQEWTAALTRWCDAQPDLVPYRGQCLVRRAEILQLHGAWPDALDAASQACERFAQPPGQRGSGAAFYQLGEIHRLRGELAEADHAYLQASRYGRNPQPGVALLRLAQGHTDSAATSIRLALEEARSDRSRSVLLPAYVDISLAAGDVRAARVAAGELSEIATGQGAAFLRAGAAQAKGAVLLAEGDASGALPVLRMAWTAWQELEAPYEAARVRVLIAFACRLLGDEDAARMELDAARWVFQQLGAGTDLARVDAEASRGTPGSDHPAGLSARELQVLRLVAAGKTNRQIAADLFISERTVERHVSNIFNKLGVSTRAAATAYAYQHQIVPSAST